MIASAHVFTPRPSSDPRENLRVLQTPLRAPFAEEAAEIVLVQSDTPRVVEEDRDLVILDEVEPEPVLPLPVPALAAYPATPPAVQFLTDVFHPLVSQADGAFNLAARFNPWKCVFLPLSCAVRA